jgi:hypothetical protein
MEEGKCTWLAVAMAIMFDGIILTAFPVLRLIVNNISTSPHSRKIFPTTGSATCLNLTIRIYTIFEISGHNFPLLKRKEKVL